MSEDLEEFLSTPKQSCKNCLQKKVLSQASSSIPTTGELIRKQPCRTANASIIIFLILALVTIDLCLIFCLIQKLLIHIISFGAESSSEGLMYLRLQDVTYF